MHRDARNSTRPLRAKAHFRGTVNDLGNGTYVASITPTVAGSYYIFVALKDQAIFWGGREGGRIGYKARGRRLTVGTSFGGVYHFTV